MARLVILLSVFFVGYLPAKAQLPLPVADIVRSVNSLVDNLDPLQKKRALLDFSDSARQQWNNLPVGLRPRAGLSLGGMTDQQRKMIHQLLSSSLSSQGYLKATSIMHLDNLLNMYYDTLYKRKQITPEDYQFIRNLQWSHKNYFFAVFGNPKKDSIWGFKLEGHHLSLNITYRPGQLSVTPMFMGTDPADFPMGEYAGWRVLAMEEDFGFKLLNSLSEAQKQKAVMSTEVPQDIITAAESGRRLVDDWGLQGKDMSKMQLELVKKIIREFVFNLAYEKAEEEYSKILKAGVEHIYFGWIGENDLAKPHYFVLNGPSFLIEFDNNGGPRRQANHIHAIWREKGNEYGEDMLKKHYESAHKQ